MMKASLIASLAVLCFSVGCTQPARQTTSAGIEVDSLFILHAKGVFTDVIDILNIDYQPVTVNAKPFSELPEGCYDAIFESLMDFGITPPDTLYWQSELDRIPEWDSLFFDTSYQLVSGDTIRAIFNDETRWWGYFYEHIEPGFLTFSLPIFFDEYHYALVYASDNCGGLCGYGAWLLLKREEDGWIFLDEYCFWIS